MRIQHTRHASHFTVMPNSILRHPRLSLAARGLLGHLLSLPDGARETVQSIAEKVSEGRITVRKAMAQLEAEGYVRRVRHQDPETGTWSTEVTVSDVPMTDQSPNDRKLTAGPAKRRFLGRQTPKETQEKQPSPTPQPVSDDTEPEGSEGGREASQQQQQDQPELGRAAAFLGRLGASEAKLSLSAAEVLTLAPLAAEWLSRGSSELEMRNVLTAGLPASVHSAVKLVANRLERKMPAPRRVADPAAPAVALRAECGDCGRPLPLGQSQGICGQCAGVQRAPQDAAPVGLADEAASLILAIRDRRAAGTVRGSRRGFATA
ncbi:helix-turn-helix domain-containing protein [Streptomyces sp. CoT10]|uniref:helix-turn-helix domain-containing protein n=1 Tax=Streptomyces sp. CoT10 TaxID=2875762 RepID=UPI001CD5D2FC|nr:helix-turn-helix domain-containing protein [Streptomyces sp. CoT10]